MQKRMAILGVIGTISKQAKSRFSHSESVGMQNLMFLTYWATVCITVRPMLSDRCLFVRPVLSVYPVCDAGVLWPNSWMDQDET